MGNSYCCDNRLKDENEDSGMLFQERMSHAAPIRRHPKPLNSAKNANRLKSSPFDFVSNKDDIEVDPLEDQLSIKMRTVKLNFMKSKNVSNDSNYLSPYSKPKKKGNGNSILWLNSNASDRYNSKDVDDQESFDDNLFKLNMSTIPNFEGTGPIVVDISYIHQSSEKDWASESDYELHDEIEKSISNSKNSQSNNANNLDCFYMIRSSDDFQPIQSNMDNNYITFGGSALEYRTSQHVRQKSDLLQFESNNFKTNDCTEQDE